MAWGLLLIWFASILASGGWTALDVVLMGCFVLGTPWSVLGFLERGAGALAVGGGRRLEQVAPFLASADRPDPISIKTAVVMTLRNEDPARALLRLKTVKASLDATSDGASFSYFVERYKPLRRRRSRKQHWSQTGRHATRIATASSTGGAREYRLQGRQRA